MGKYRRKIEILMADLCAEQKFDGKQALSLKFQWQTGLSVEQLSYRYISHNDDLGFHLYFITF